MKSSSINNATARIEWFYQDTYTFRGRNFKFQSSLSKKNKIHDSPNERMKLKVIESMRPSTPTAAADRFSIEKSAPPITNEDAQKLSSGADVKWVTKDKKPLVLIGYNTDQEKK